MIVEVCCGGYEDAVHAWDGGADRIELNSGLALGGLTPGVGTLRLIKEHCPGLEIIVMVRPRGGGFCYSQAEYLAMLADAEALLDAGADGIAFGFLAVRDDVGVRSIAQCDQENGGGRIVSQYGNVDGGARQNVCVIDTARTREMVARIHEYGRAAVFHRAFDIAGATDEAMETLISLGVDRVLTSGGMDTSVHGASRIADLVQRYGTRIEIVAGSGVNADNAAWLISQTGVTQVHSSCKEWICDPTADAGAVSFSYDVAHSGMFDAVSEMRVRALCEAATAAMRYERPRSRVGGRMTC